MKPVVIVLLILLCLSSASSADIYDNKNIITIKPDPYSSAHDFDCWNMQENTVRTLTLYLHQPVNYDFNGGQEREVTNVWGFECRLELTEGLTILDWYFPVPSINVGTGNTLVVGYSVPLPVVDGVVELATFDILFGDADFELPDYGTGPCYLHANTSVFIGPTEIPAIPGSTAYVDYDDTGNNLVAGITAEDYDFRFLLTKEDPVDTEDHTWGAMKALYR
jgi:hypothetical protein